MATTSLLSSRGLWSQRSFMINAITRHKHARLPVRTLKRQLHNTPILPASDKTSAFRNVSFWGHIDAGKTTLTEKVLYLANALVPPSSSSEIAGSQSSRMLPGDVDSGSTVTDFLEAERQRGITIQSAAVGPFGWKSEKNAAKIILVDTPGHIDFTIEVERSLRVADGCVILIDGVEGVESQTEGVWKIAKRYNVRSHVAFVNKLDRMGASIIRSIRSIIQKGLHSRPMLLQLPVFASKSSMNTSAGSSMDEECLTGLIDLTSTQPMMVNFFGGKAGENIERLPLEEAVKEGRVLQSLADEAFRARSVIVENAANLDEKFLDQTLKAMESDNAGDDYTALIDTDSLRQCIRRLVVRGEVLPVLCGSAARGVGVQAVLDAVVDYLPSPGEAGDFDAAIERNVTSGCVWGEVRMTRDERSDPKKGRQKKDRASVAQDVARPGQDHVSILIDDQALSLLAFKVVWDKRKGPMTFVRLYSGSLTRSSTLLNTMTGSRERLSKILFVYADRHVETDRLEAGQIGVLLGLKDTRTGDTLVDVRMPTGKPSKKDDGDSWSKYATSLTLRQVNVPPPVFSMSIEPLSKSDEGPLREALDMLIRTDPSLHLDQGTTSGGTALGSVAASTGGQMVLSGMGELHLEIARDRLREEFGAKAHLGNVRVSYRETVVETGDPSIEEHSIDRDVLGQRLKASCSMSVRALLPEEMEDAHFGGNQIIIDEIADEGDDAQSSKGDSKTHQRGPTSTSTLETFDRDAIRRALQAGLTAALSRGPLSGNPVTGVSIHISNVQSYGAAVSPAKAFSLLASQALRESLRSAGVVLMEPFMNVRIQCDEESLGKVVANLTSEQDGTVEQVDHAMDGNVDQKDTTDTVYIPSPEAVKDGPSSNVAAMTGSDRLSNSDGKCTISAVVPLVRLVRYSSILRALTKGKATYEMAFLGFSKVSPERQREILVGLGRL
ncbi:P-loop containing nucleoside triphosphate hydrolase protein [Meira miltonrushii]|uniref:Elongation factor 2 n=1 Tax=Meira miltonrushii TaxID=1280837 RepID=A0A316VAX4_9BASI|nr:P-loop containing nucleoside triphosphate hydrolase protein [Meira miltonrushii]PWN34414.1 P-loop containing nucleoside triphosphate hydrolase protein [Meira miltonrushii]